jgi:regulator of replication initiation timing
MQTHRNDSALLKLENARLKSENTVLRAQLAEAQPTKAKRENDCLKAENRQLRAKLAETAGATENGTDGGGIRKKRKARVSSSWSTEHCYLYIFSICREAENCRFSHPEGAELDRVRADMAIELQQMRAKKDGADAVGNQTQPAESDTESGDDRENKKRKIGQQDLPIKTPSSTPTAKEPCRHHLLGKCGRASGAGSSTLKMRTWSA